MRRAIIHIGLEKTGSTFIQDFFSLNKQEIREYGLYYSQCLTGKNHARLVLLGQENETTPNKIHRWVGLEPEKVQSANQSWLEEVGAESSGALTFWASSEFLSSILLRQENCRQFIDNLRRVFDVVSIVVFVRKQEELLLSRYSTSVLDGNYEPMQIDKVPGEVRVLSILERWGSLLKPENFFVLPYFSDLNVRELIEILVTRTTGLKPELSRFFWPKGEVNSRLTFSGLEAIRRINERYGAIPSGKRPEVLSFVTSKTQHEQKFTLTEERFLEATERFASVNKEIALALTETDRERFLEASRTDSVGANAGYDPKLVDRLETTIRKLMTS